MTLGQRLRPAGRVRGGGGPCLVTVVMWLLLGPAAAPAAAPEDRARELVERLSSDRWEVREQATGELIEMGRAAYAALREALDSGDAELRYRSRMILEAPARRSGKVLREAIEQGQAPSWVFGPAPFLGPRRTDVSGAAMGGTPGVMSALNPRGLGRHTGELRRLDWMLAEPLISVLGRWTHAAQVLESRSGLSSDERTRLVEFRHGVQLAAWMLGEVWRFEDTAKVIEAFCLLPLEHHASLEDLVADLPHRSVAGFLAQIAGDPQVGAPVKARAVRLLGIRLAAQRPEASAAAALTTLVKAVRDPHAVVRREAVDALLWVAPPPGVAGGDLVAAVAVEPSAVLRERMVNLAGVLAERYAEPLLAALLSDAAVDTALRVVAARALGNLAPLGPGVMGTLRALVSDESEPLDLRDAAVASLGVLGDRAVVGLLGRILGQGASDLDPRVLLMALGRIGGAEAMEVLREVTTVSEPALAVEAVRALGLARRSPGEAGQILRGILTQGGTVMQVAAVQAVGDLGHGPTLDLVIRHLRSRDRLVRGALTAVTVARQPRAVDALVALLAEKRTPQEVRASAVNALSMIRSPRAQPALRQVIGGSTARPALRVAAARALSRCGDPGAMGAVLTANERRRNASGRGSYQLNTRGIDYLYARDSARAVSAFRSMLREKNRDNVAHYNIACAFALAGDRARALRYLWRSVRSGFDDPSHMDADPDLDSLRGDRRFEVLMRYSRGIVSAAGGSGG